MKTIFLLTLIAIVSCNSNTTTTKTKKTEAKQKQKKSIEISLKSDKNEAINIGEDVFYTYKIKKYDLPDSIKLSVDFKTYKTFAKNEELIWNTSDYNPGFRKLDFIFYWGDTLTSSKSAKQELLSNIKPTTYTFKTINKWAHNVKAYTQGLEFSDGYLYEGTGLHRESMLYKIDLDKNEIVQSVNLPDELFGEGITIIQNKIYQITWQSNIGYVYDKNTLKKLYNFTYPTEGWGLTNNDDELIMSDGSEIIYFLDTEFIQETHKIQVYDDNGSVKNLNELEYIDGLIYANIYGKDEIIAFESETGKVIKKINLSGILNKNSVKTPIDVLNGIAWDHNKNRLIVTGKWWPYYYEIELVEK